MRLSFLSLNFSSVNNGIPMKRLLYLVFLLSTGSPVLARTTDSLENVLKTAKGEQKVKTLNELFRGYLNADPVKAIGYAREALVLATDIDDRKGMAAAYNNLGVAYRNQGALEKALEYYLISLTIYDKLQNKEGIATTQNNIGTIYSLKKDYGQAMKYFEESHKAFMELNDPVKIIGSMNNLGNLHSDLQLYEQARKYYIQAWQLSKKTGNASSDPVNNIGNLFFREGNYQKAVEYYEQALTLANKENNNLAILNIIANLGEVYAKAGQSKKAQVYLDQALKMSKELQATLLEPQILKSLSTSYAKEGKMKEAYETMLLYDIAREKIYGEESSRKIAQMSMALDLNEREKEVESLKKEDQIKTLQLRNTRMIVTTVVFGLILLVGIFNVFFSKRRLIRRS
jgi:tetratricopeptide (TPR) repeat protein